MLSHSSDRLESLVIVVEGQFIGTLAGRIVKSVVPRAHEFKPGSNICILIRGRWIKKIGKFQVRTIVQVPAVLWGTWTVQKIFIKSARLKSRVPAVFATSDKVDTLLNQQTVCVTHVARRTLWSPVADRRNPFEALKRSLSATPDRISSCPDGAMDTCTQTTPCKNILADTSQTTNVTSIHHPITVPANAYGHTPVKVGTDVKRSIRGQTWARLELCHRFSHCRTENSQCWNRPHRLVRNVSDKCRSKHSEVKLLRKAVTGTSENQQLLRVRQTKKHDQVYSSKKLS